MTTLRTLAAALVIVVLACSPSVAAPTGTTPGAARTTPSPSPVLTPSPSPAATPAPPAPRETEAIRTLTLEDALRRALDGNVEVLVARERVREAQGLAAQARSPLLPHLGFSAQQANVTVNLAAQGFAGNVLPGVPLFIGPFFSFDSRLRLTQSLINTSAVLEARKGRLGVEMAHLQERLAREQVASAVEVAYISLLRAERGILDAQANFDLAASLLKLAQHQHDAGVATGLDVTRADTRLSQEMVRLAQARATETQARLNLQHLVGVPLGQDLSLADPLQGDDIPLPPLESTLEAARAGRIELKLAQEQVQVLDLEVRAARAEYGPTVALAADYGIAGETPVSKSSNVHAVGLQVAMPIFDGGRTRGRVMEALSRRKQNETRLLDLLVQIEQDVRLALEGLQTSRAQVTAATRATELANRELRMARDRFKAGLGDNVEVLTAQTALSNARDALAAALAGWQTARINLAAAIGAAQEFRLDNTAPPSPGTAPGGATR